MPSTVFWLAVWDTGLYPALLLSCLNHWGHLGSFCEWNFSQDPSISVDGCLLWQGPCLPTYLPKNRFQMMSQLRSWQVGQQDEFGGHNSHSRRAGANW